MKNKADWSLDPFIENEYLSKMTLKEDQRFRKSSNCFTMKDDWDFDGKTEIKLNVRRGKQGKTIEFRIRSWSDRKTAKTHKCDLGHHHPVIVRELNETYKMDMRHPEARALYEFLKEHFE